MILTIQWLVGIRKQDGGLQSVDFHTFLEYDPNAVIQTRYDVCSEANEHEHSPHCEEEQPECDFFSKYRSVFFQIFSRQN